MSSSELSIALALTAVVVAVALPALTENEFSMTALWPGIATATALLIASPIPGLADWHNDVALILMPLATGMGAVLYRKNAQAMPIKMALSLALAAAIFAAVAGMQWHAQHAPPRISFIAVTLDAFFFLLPLLALNRLTALQYSARYALVPLLLLAEGMLFISHALISLRIAICFCLLLTATIALLRFRNEENVA